MNILMGLGSHGRLGNTDRRTGLWLEEPATPYYVFRNAGAEATLASPDGERPPVGPNSERADSATAATRRFSTETA